MKTYRNEQLGFELEVPEEWTPPRGRASHTPFGDSIPFDCSYIETFNLQVSPLDPASSPEQTANKFQRYVQDNNYTSLEFGRLTVEGKEHTWARFYLGSGKWGKKYWIALDGIEYAITATCFFQNKLLEREKVWDQVVTSFHLVPAADRVQFDRRPTIQGPQISAESPDKPAGEQELKPGDDTLVFSLISYSTIALLALVYIHFKVGFEVLLSLNDALFSRQSGNHYPLSSFEFTIVWIVMAFGIGACVCLMFLLGVVRNARNSEGESSFFDFIDRTMQIHDRLNETIGSLLFSDYSRKPRNAVEAVHLQISSLRHALIKIVTLPLFIGQTHPVIMSIFAILLILPRFILRHPLYVSFDAMYILCMDYFCYRAFLFQTARRREVSRTGDALRNRLVISSPSLDSTIQSASERGVTPEFIEKILCQESILDTIKNDLRKTGQIGYKEVWRFGLITPDQDQYDPNPDPASRRERTQKYFKDPNYRLKWSEQIPLKRAAVLHSTSYFNVQFNNVMVIGGKIQPRISAYPGWSYHLDTELHQGEFMPIRSIRVNDTSEYSEGRIKSLPEFLREEGFPLQRFYADGDPLTTDRGGTIVLDKGEIQVIYPRYFVQRRLIDDEGNLVDIGIDENFGHSPLFEVKMRPSVSKILYLTVSNKRYTPVVRYRSFPYSSEFMLPILDTPMSANGWADLFIDTAGKARLFIAKWKTDAEWVEVMNRLKQLFFAELARVDYHFLGLTQDKARLNQYLSQKQEILKDYFTIQDWRLY
jgi:hypothetical protein